jgi:hypothetical protein
LKGSAALRQYCLGSLLPVSVWVFVPVSPVRVGTCGGRFLPPVPMNSMESPKNQELQTLGNRAWDNPAYSDPPSPNRTLRICTVSSVALPETQPKKPEVRCQEKTQRTLVSSCCLHICRSIRGTGHKERFSWRVRVREGTTLGLRGGQK